MKTLTKSKIEEFAQAIIRFLEKENLESDVSIYFNNKVIRREGKWDEGYENYTAEWITTENVDPHDYFEYAAFDHILSMSFEGPLYDILNYTHGRKEDKFDALFKKWGLYHEQGNAWNLTAYPLKSDIEIEYTQYKRPKETIYLYHNADIPEDLQVIMTAWYESSKAEGNKGSCVRGAGFEFEYEDNKYFMPAQSPWKGSLSWEAHKDTIKKMLKYVGATDIVYKWGNMN